MCVHGNMLVCLGVHVHTGMEAEGRAQVSSSGVLLTAFKTWSLTNQSGVCQLLEELASLRELLSLSP